VAINGCSESFYGLVREAFIFAMTSVFCDQPFRQLPTSRNVHVLENDFFDLIGCKFELVLPVQDDGKQIGLDHRS